MNIQTQNFSNILFYNNFNIKANGPQQEDWTEHFKCQNIRLRFYSTAAELIVCKNSQSWATPKFSKNAPPVAGWGQQIGGKTSYSA